MPSDACGKSNVNFTHEVSELDKNSWGCTFSGSQETISADRNAKQRHKKRKLKIVSSYGMNSSAPWTLDPL